MQARSKLESDLRSTLEAITCYKHEKNEILAKVIVSTRLVQTNKSIYFSQNKLQLLTILPLAEYNQYSTSYIIKRKTNRKQVQYCHQ